MADDTQVKEPDFSGLRVRTLQQAKTELPQPAYMAPAEDLMQGTKLGKAYDAAKQWFGEHEEHLSEKVLKPFREGLDNMAADLQDAGESGHTKTGGQLTTPTRLLAEGTGALLKMVPVGKDLKETTQMAALPSVFEGLRVRPLGAADKAIFEAAEGESEIERLRRTGPATREAIPETNEQIEETARRKELKEAEERVAQQKGLPGSAKKETTSPREIIEKQGLVYKGEVSRGSGVHMFEHPAHPGKTAALNEHQISPDNVKEKMASKLKEFGVKPIKFSDSELVKNAPKASKGLKEPENRSRIVIEGIDEPKANPEGRYSDKIKIDPFKKGYIPPVKRKPILAA